MGTNGNGQYIWVPGLADIETFAYDSLGLGEVRIAFGLIPNPKEIKGLLTVISKTKVRVDF